MSLLIGATSALQGASGQGAAGFEIDQSLRYSASNLDFVRAFSGAGDRDTWTFSTWIKRGDLSSTQGLFGCSTASNDVDYFEILFTGGGALLAQGSSTVFRQTNALFRDPAAWYHIIVVADTNNGTALDRIRFYVNGSKVTSWSTSSTISSGSSLGINQADNHRVGLRPAGTDPLEGYLAQTQFLDGIAVSDTGGVVDEFGEYNTDGVWIPKEYTGNYGTNGFKLIFDNSAGIGDDSSPNTNDFTASNFETTAISSSNPDNDVDIKDTPTSNYPTWNPLIKNDGSYAKANLQYVAPGSDSTTGSTFVFNTSNSISWYVELTHTLQNRSAFGVCNQDERFFDTFDPRSTAAPSIVYDSNGPIWVDGSEQSPSQSAWNTGSVISMRFDSSTRNLIFANNGTDQTGVTTTLPADKDVTIICGDLTGVGSGSQFNINFGQMSFLQTVPTGFVAPQTNNLTEPAVKNGKGHFGVLLYNGNGSTQTVTDTDEVDFTPDFVWIKARTGTRNHFAFDCIRGGTKGLLVNDTNSDVTRSTFLSSFDSGGFSVGADGDINANTVATVAWCWKAGGTPTATNSAGAGNVPTAGSVKIDGANKTDALAGANPATKISANTTAGFSIVQYNGTGSQTTVAHGLTQTPEFIIINNRDNNANRSVYHKDSYVSHTDPGVLYFNDPQARSASGTDTNVFGTSAITLNNTVFTVGTYEGTNASAGDEHIAYVFHSVEGFSKVGLFTGNASADGPFVNTGFRPAFILFKVTNNSSNWQLIDTARDPINNGTSTVLRPDEATEESTTLLDHVDILSNGFKIRDGGGFNGSSWKISYLAFAEHPFGGENTPPVTAR